MGTRSITHIIDTDNPTPLLTFYRQMDGYLEGHGQDLAEILAGGKVVNGYSLSDEKQFNGPGCLAAQVIAGLKHGVGNIYIEPPGSHDMGEEFTYLVRVTPAHGFDGQGEIEIEVYDADKMAFRGDPDSLLADLKQGSTHGS